MKGAYGNIEARIGALEARLRQRVVRLADIQWAFVKAAESARAKLSGKPTDSGILARVRDVIARWAKAEGADLEALAERARHRLMVVDGTPAGGAAEGDDDEA